MKRFGGARRAEVSRGKNRAVREPIQKSSQGPFYPIMRPCHLPSQAFLFATLLEYGKNLDAMIESETGGDLEKLFIEILKVTLVNPAVDRNCIAINVSQVESFISLGRVIAKNSLQKTLFKHTIY